MNKIAIFPVREECSLKTPVAIVSSDQIAVCRISRAGEVYLSEVGTRGSFLGDVAKLPATDCGGDPLPQTWLRIC
jgi:hypothetical protein